MLNVAIIEDEQSATDTLLSYIDRFECDYGTAISAVTYGEPTMFLDVYRPDYDIVFMDIEMPNMDGMEAAHRLRDVDRRAVLIFVTNVAKLAIRGYEVDAFDYIVKPVDYSTFARKLKGAIARCRRNEDTLMLPNRGGAQLIQLRDIVYVEVRGHTLHFHTRDGVVSGNGKLQDTTQRLHGHGFLRCGKAFLVNCLHILNVDGTTITLDNGEELTIGRAFRKTFLQDFADSEGNAHVR